MCFQNQKIYFCPKGDQTVAIPKSNTVIHAGNPSIRDSCFFLAAGQAPSVCSRICASCVGEAQCQSLAGLHEVGDIWSPKAMEVEKGTGPRVCLFRFKLIRHVQPCTMQASLSRQSAVIQVPTGTETQALTSFRQPRMLLHLAQNNNILMERWLFNQRRSNLFKKEQCTQPYHSAVFSSSAYHLCGRTATSHKEELEVGGT